MSYCTVVKDVKGNEVKASEIYKGMLFNDFEKGLFGTLRNEEYTFWADVECLSKRGSKYTFVSTTYGHKFIVDVEADTVICKG